MSYHVWSENGYGFDVSKIINNLTLEKWSLLRATIYLFWEKTTPYSDEDYPEAKEFFDTPITNNVAQDIDKARKIFNEYASDVYWGIIGFDGLVAETLTWLWKTNEHDDKLINMVVDDFDDFDGSHIYWLISPVYPWWKGEKFNSEDDCKNAIIKSMNGLITAGDIDHRSIECGG